MDSQWREAPGSSGALGEHTSAWERGYAAGTQAEREHQEALAQLVVLRHEAEIAKLHQRVAELEAEFANAKRWEPVPYSLTIAFPADRYPYVEETGELVRLCRLIAGQEGQGENG